MDERALAFLEEQRAASMVTLRADGTPHAVRVGVAVVDGKVWSSGVPSRVRTRHLRRDPRCTLFVFETPTGDAPAYRWLTLEGTVTILEGPDVPEQSVRLFEVMQRGMPRPEGQLFWEGQPRDLDEFRRIMAEEQRLIYQLDVTRSYGMY